MKKLTSSLFVTMLFFGLAFLGQFHAQVHAQVREHMDLFYVSISDLQPYLHKKSKFIDETSKSTVETLLGDLSNNVKKLKLKKMAQDDNMRFRIQLLNEGFEEATKAYKDGFRDYAFWVTKSTLYNCSSCHTEKGLPETKFKFNFSTQVTDFERAEFLFMIRNYSESTRLFNMVVEKYPENGVNLEDLMTSVRKLVYYSMRVKKDDDHLLKMLTTFLKNKELPIFMIRDMNQWKKYLEIKKYRILPDALPFDTVKRLDDFISERDQIASHFGEGQQRFIVDQETLSFLHESLSKNLDIELKNSIFYWISKLQRQYRESMFDSSAEIYLTECIKLTKLATRAKTCFEEYREQKLETFDTRQVKELPNNIRLKLDDLEAKVKSLTPSTKK